MLERGEKVGIEFEFPNIFGFIIFLVTHHDFLCYLNPFNWQSYPVQKCEVDEVEGNKGREERKELVLAMES